MISVSAAFKTEADKKDNFPSMSIIVYYSDSFYRNESINLVAASFISSGTQSVGSLTTQQATTTGQLTLANMNYRYTPGRTTGGSTDTELWTYIENMPEDGFELSIWCGFDISGTVVSYTTYKGRVVDYEYDEVQNTVIWSIVDMTWETLQRKDSTDIFSGLDYKEISDEYGIAISPRSHQTRHVWMDDDSYMNDTFKMSNSTLGYRFDNPTSGTTDFHSADTWYINNRSYLASPLYFFDSTHSYTNVTSRTNVKNRPTEIIVNFSPRYVGPQQTLFELDEPIVIGAAVDGSTPTEKAFYLKSLYPIYAYSQPVEGQDYAITSGLGINMSDFVSASFALTAQEIVLTMSNSHEYLSATMRYLVITGYPTFGGPSGREKEKSKTGTFKRSATAGDPFYIQTRAHAKWLTDVLVDRMQYVLPTRIIASSPPLFWLTVGDLVEYQLVDGAETIKAFIASVATNYADGVITQSFEIIDYSYLYPAPDENYFVIGDSLTASKVAFY